VPGGYPDTTPPSAEFDDHDDDDHDDGPDGDDSSPDGPDTSFVTHRSEGDDRDRTPVPAAASSEPSTAVPEKPAFSLFSWIRRDPPPSVPPTGDKPGPEEDR
jgi:hypothetical protein